MAWVCALLIALLPAMLVAGEVRVADSATADALHRNIAAYAVPVNFAGLQSPGMASLPPPVVAAQATFFATVQIQGTVSYDIHSSGVTDLHVDQITNTSSGSTGTLRIELWATSVPWASATQGYKIAQYQIAGSSNGTLGPGQYFSNITATVSTLTIPADGTYYMTMVVSEYDPNPSECSASDGFCTADYLGFDNLKTFGSGGSAPVCSPYASPATFTSAGGNVNLYSNCSNSPTSYTWVNAGNTLSYDANFSATLPPNNGSSPATYVFTVTAANGSGSDTESVSVTVAGSGGHVAAPSPDYSPCFSDATTACLLNGRFRVQANWGNNPGSGGPTSIMYFNGGRAETDNAAVFYFTSPNFFEIGLTLYNGCSYGGVPYTWVFIGGLTDFSWAMTISDTEHGVANQYFNNYHTVTQTTTDYYSGLSCN